MGDFLSVITMIPPLGATEILINKNSIESIEEPTPKMVFSTVKELGILRTKTGKEYLIHRNEYDSLDGFLR